MMWCFQQNYLFVEIPVIICSYFQSKNYMYYISMQSMCKYKEKCPLPLIFGMLFIDLLTINNRFSIFGFTPYILFRCCWVDAKFQLLSWLSGLNAWLEIFLLVCDHEDQNKLVMVYYICYNTNSTCLSLHTSIMKF